MSRFTVSYWSESKRRMFAIEELSDIHLLNAARKYAQKPHHQWGDVSPHRYGDLEVRVCTLCGTNQVSSEDPECPQASRLLSALREEVDVRGLDEQPKQEDSGQPPQDIDWGAVVTTNREPPTRTSPTNTREGKPE